MSKRALPQAAYQALSMMDLTSLNDDDNDHSIKALCQQAHTPFGHVAAVCIYPRFITTAVAALAEQQQSERVAIATVVNFPHGNSAITKVVQEIKQAIADGAQEIDLVLPYQRLQTGDASFALEMVRASRVACAGAILKVIIESGELGTPALITEACELAIAGGADFIKTSTGKVPINATLMAAEVMLQVIRSSGKPIGFKAAGGVRTTADAQQYLRLATDIMGIDWVTSSRMRFGASSLLVQLLATLEGEAVLPPGADY